MKRFITLFTVLLLSIANLTLAQTDLLTRIPVKDGYNKALSDAEAKGLNSPELMFAGTFDKEITLTMPPGNQEVTIATDFQLEDGRSKVWLYSFRDKNDHNLKASFLIGYISFLDLGYISYEVNIEDYIPSSLPVFGDTPFDISSIINSDEMGQIFLGNSSVSTFLSDHPMLDNKIAAVSVNPALEFITGDTPLWILLLSAGDDILTCAINNQTKANLCDNQVEGIEEKSLQDVGAYPQPAGNFVMIKTGESLTAGSSSDVDIYDLFGKTVKSCEIINSGREIRINLSGLKSGVYMVQIMSGNKSIIKRIIIAR